MQPFSGKVIPKIFVTHKKSVCLDAHSRRSAAAAAAIFLMRVVRIPRRVVLLSENSEKFPIEEQIKLSIAVTFKLQISCISGWK